MKLSKRKFFKRLLLTSIGGFTLRGSAPDNTINISGTPDLSGTTLYGGPVDSSAYGNTLNINTWGLTTRTKNFPDALPNLSVAFSVNTAIQDLSGR